MSALSIRAEYLHLPKGAFMLRKALMGAAAAGAATLFAVGAASPAMAYGSGSDEYNQNDYGDVNVLSNFCVNISEINVVQVLDLLSPSNASCEWDNSNVWINSDGDNGHKHDH
jgi:hypothetical protein